MQTDTNGPHNTAILCWRMTRLRDGRGLTPGPPTGPLGPPSEASTAEGSPAGTHRQRTDSAPSPLTQSKAATRATAPLPAYTVRLSVPCGRPAGRPTNNNTHPPRDRILGSGRRVSKQKGKSRTAKMESDNGRQIKYYIGRRDIDIVGGSSSSRGKAWVRAVPCPTRRLDRRIDRSPLASRVVS